ncbi:MFS transporter [Ktedonosporobacter rubrisoli]|uniref:MFS transporter n=1 Tax=Ktedonosporobacter rubrisoli TaxID=2509675 RepID=A0A4P6JPT8_KTERU|nr:MFS transporter [Ktedonosporobacter rubrisoli]QBD77407.1 MFS transporter [Ktedonosporobacter rubrisoli]
MMKKISRLSIREQLTLNILWFSINLQYAALLPVVIPTQILLFVTPGKVGDAQQALFLSWLSTVASVVSLGMPPLVGTLSDHTTGKLGRRRPYIAIGGLFLIASTPFLVLSNSILIFLLGLSLLHLGNNVLTPAYQSLVPDQVPEEQRGEASGYVGAMTILGNVASLGLAALLLGGINQNAYSKSVIHENASIYYIVGAAALVVAIIITIVFVKEKPLVPDQHVIEEEAGEKFLTKFARWFAHGWNAPWHSYNFVVVFLTRSAIMLGLALFMTYVEYYFARVQHVTNFVQITALVAVLALGGGVVSGVVFGVLSDHLKRRAPVVCVATFCMSLTSIAFVVVPANLINWLWPLGALFGLGYGAYTSVDWALSVDALPSLKEAGEDLGVWNATMNLPAIIAPLIGSLIINTSDKFGQIELGYRLVFLVASLFLIVAAVAVLFVREQQMTSNLPQGRDSK